MSVVAARRPWSRFQSVLILLPCLLSSSVAVGPGFDDEVGASLPASEGTNETVQESGISGDARRLQTPPSLPLVSAVDFADEELELENVSGTVTWAGVSSIYVTGYEVYLSDLDGTHTDHWPWGNIHLGSVPFGTNELEIANVTTGGLTHVFVHSRSALGTNPTGARAEVCDVGPEDTVVLTASAATTAPWGLVEVSFHLDADCNDVQLHRAFASSSSNAADAWKGVDRETSTAWQSGCTSCPAGTEQLEVLGVCRSAEIACVNVRQCKGDGQYGCGVASRTSAITMERNGAEVMTWRFLAGMPSLREELFTIPGRRRRASFATFENTPSYERRTSCLGNPPTYECTIPR